MASKSLTESGWRAVAQKFKLKDASLQKQLCLLETFDDDEYDDRLKGIASVIQFANAVKKSKEAAANPEVVKYLTSLLKDADSEKTEIARAKAGAEKTAAVTQKKAEAEAKQRDEDEEESAEEEEEEGDYAAKLLATFQKLKSAKDLAYQFIVCEAKPLGLMVAKKISPLHKAQLIKLTGGKRFYPVGTCAFVEGKYHFTTEKPLAGMARRLQEAIKSFTGKKLPIVVGGEAAEADDEQPSAAPSAQAASAPRPEPPGLAKAPDLWNQTRNTISNSIDQLKTAIRAAFANQGADLLADVEQKFVRLDAVSGRFDHRLSECLGKAHATQEPGARKAELSNAKTILTDYIKYVKSEPLIAHIDSNPFGVKTNLKHTLAESLTHMAQAIG